MIAAALRVVERRVLAAAQQEAVRYVVGVAVTAHDLPAGVDPGGEGVAGCRVRVVDGGESIARQCQAA
jgi:hypothetical protein